jgi:acetyl-CoA C-acetyltransferase
MAEAYVYDAVRTPRGRGKKDGSLHEVPAVRLTAKVLEAVRDRNGLDTSQVDDIIFGCVDPVGEAGSVIPRAATFEAGYATQAPGIQVSRFCASGLDAIAMGHPLGATGAMIFGTVLDELERRNLNTALVTLCIGAGMGTATIIERV